MACRLQHLVVDGLLGCRLVVVAERLHAARALDHAQRAAVGVELDARCGGAAATRASPSTPSRGTAGCVRPSRRRRCARCAPRACRCPARAVRARRRSARAEPIVPGFAGPLSERRTTHMAVELDHSFTTAQADRRQLRDDPRPRARHAVRRGRRACSSAPAPTSVKAEIKVKMGAMSMTFTGTRRDHRAGRRGAPASC